MNYRPNSQLARRGLLAIAPLAAVLLASGCGTNASVRRAAESQAFPAANTKVEWIVPSAAGAGNDILARSSPPALEKQLGAPVRVVNKEGGNQVIGLNYLANSKPDGQTMGYTNIPSIFGRYLDPSKKASFNRESFAPVGSFAFNDVVIGVNKSSPYSTIGDLFDAVKAKPGAITVGTDSRAGDDHVNLRVLEGPRAGLQHRPLQQRSRQDRRSRIRRGRLRPRRPLQLRRALQVRRGQAPDHHQRQAEHVPARRPHAGVGRVQGRADDEQLRRLGAGRHAARHCRRPREGAQGRDRDPKRSARSSRTPGRRPRGHRAAEVAQKWPQREAKAKPIIDELLKENA